MTRVLGRASASHSPLCVTGRWVIKVRKDIVSTYSPAYSLSKGRCTGPEKGSELIKVTQQAKNRDF